VSQQQREERQARRAVLRRQDTPNPSELEAALARQEADLRVALHGPLTPDAAALRLQTAVRGFMVRLPLPAASGPRASADSARRPGASTPGSAPPPAPPPLHPRPPPPQPHLHPHPPPLLPLPLPPLLLLLLLLRAWLNRCRRRQRKWRNESRRWRRG
jgi:hypothetical protein